MNMLQCILTKNDCYKVGRTIQPKGVMVHSTGANNPNIARYVPIGTYTNHWNKTGIQKCVHAFIGKHNGEVQVCKTLPWNMRGWHAGTGRTGYSANNTHISFEVCEDDLKDADYFWKAIRKAQELTAYLCELYNLDPLKDGVVISHHEGHERGVASNHADIDHWLKLYSVSMTDFRNGVAKIMKEGDKVEIDIEARSKWAIDEGIYEFIEKHNISDGTRPQAFATREEIFAMLTRAMRAMGKE